MHQARRLPSAFRSTPRRAKKIPAAVDPSAYPAARSEKLPGPRPSVSRTSVGTPTIQVPDEIVTPTPSTTTAVASVGSGRSAVNPSRTLGAAVAAPGIRRVRTPASRPADTRNEAALIAKNALIGRNVSSAPALAQPSTDRVSVVARTSPFAAWTF